MRKQDFSAIYCITNTLNAKIYIGSASNYLSRKTNHLSFLRRNNHQNKHLQRAFNKYGESNFEFNIIEIVEEKENLIKREQVWIDFFKPEYNICKFAGSTLGRITSVETRIKMGDCHRGSKNHNFNKPVSKERIKKYIETRKSNIDVTRQSYINMQRKRMKPVIQYDLAGKELKEFESVAKASKELKINKAQISGCLQGRNKTAGKFIWKQKIIIIG